MSSNLKEHPKVIALAIVAAVVLGAGLAYTYWPTGQPTMPETMEDVPALLESRAYANLSPEQRRPYVQRVSELMRNSDHEQRREVMQSSDASRDAMRDMFKQIMVDRAKQFALADAATRAQMIAQDREKMQQFGKRGGPGGPRGGEGGRGGQGSENGGDRGDRPEPTEEERAERRKQHESKIEQWVNEGNGQEWALIREYMQHVRPKKD